MQPYPVHPQGTPKKSGFPIGLLIGGLGLAIVMLIATVVVVWLVVAKPELSALRGEHSQTAYAQAETDALSLKQLQELAASDPNPKSTVSVPTSIDDALVKLAGRTQGRKHSFGLQQRVAAEYLYGGELSESDRDRVAEAVAVSMTTDLNSRQEELLLLKVFRRWGNAEQLPKLFVATMGNDGRGLTKGREQYRSSGVLGQLLEAAELYPTADVAPWVVGLLDSSNGQQAENVLRKIGPGVAPYMIGVHDSDDTKAVARTTRLFESFGTDVMQTRIDWYLSQAKTNSSWDYRTAYLKIAKLEPSEPYQQQVIDFLNQHDHSRLSWAPQWLSAVQKWGDQRCIESVCAVLQNGYRWRAAECLPFLKRYGDERAIDALVTMLTGKHYLRDRSEVAETLISLCRSNPGIDLKKRVHQPIVRQVHELYGDSAEDIWRVLRATQFDPKIVVKQSLDDLSSPDSSRERAAWETMASMEVESSLRAEVAKRMGVILETESYISDKKRTVFLRWATPSDPLIIKWLQKKHLPARVFEELMRKAINGPAESELLILVADAIAEKSTQQEMMKILLSDCQSPNPIAVGLLKSTNPTVMQAGCFVLARNGNGEHLNVLSELYKMAIKARNADVAKAAKNAGRAIKARTST